MFMYKQYLKNKHSKQLNCMFCKLITKSEVVRESTKVRFLQSNFKQSNCSQIAVGLVKSKVNGNRTNQCHAKGDERKMPIFGVRST